MMVNDADFLGLRLVSRANLDQALGLVNGYLKFASILWIRSLGQPTLDGIIIRRWSAKTADAVRAFCAKNGNNELLLRIDKRGTRWSARRGGYIIPAADVEQTVRELSKLDTITAMLEPASPHRDLYCLACVILPEENKSIIEVVGPGFDTSDLVRSDLLPHERFDVSLPFEERQPAAGLRKFVKRTYVIAPDTYKKSVEDRLTKIGARLRNPAFPNEVSGEPDKLREDALRFLHRHREDLLLLHAKRYTPIPESYLLRFIMGVRSMLTGLERHGIRLGTVTFSGTFTTRKRLVYWDFFPADTKKGHLLYSPPEEPGTGNANAR
jgi:hypothetical protein